MWRKISIVFMLLLISSSVCLSLTVMYLDYRYPLRYRTEVHIFAEKYDVEPALINSVINAESGFDKDVVSRAGALGLMQLMPSTARWLSEKTGMTDFADSDLFVPSINIELGVFYLSYLLQKFGDTDTALAAYNAGEGNVAAWLALSGQKCGEPLDPSAIPFGETRNYIARINRFYKIYLHRR